jgi:peptidoglycan/LPS O-acetylase OafA/YrhL
MLHGFLFNQEPGIASLFEFSVGFAVMAAAVGLATLSHFYLDRPIAAWDSA